MNISKNILIKFNNDSKITNIQGDFKKHLRLNKKDIIANSDTFFKLFSKKHQTLIKKHILSKKSSFEDICIETLNNKKKFKIQFINATNDLTILVMNILEQNTLDLFKNSFIESFPFSIAILNLSGNPVYVNPAFLKLWELPHPDIIMNVYNIFKDSEYKKKGLMPLIKRAFKGEVIHIPHFKYESQKEKSYIDNYGNKKTNLVTEYKWVKKCFFPIKENNKLKYIILTQEDVTAQNDLQKKLIKNEKLAAVGTLVSGIAHEFNNILGIMLGSIQLARINKNSLSYSSDRVFTIIRSQIKRAANITKRLLTFSRKTPKKYSEFNIKDSILNILNLVNTKIMRSDIEIRLIQDNDDLKIFFDETDFHRMIINVLFNSIDAIKLRENISGMIKIFVSDQSDHTLLTIEDNGIGMSNDVQNKIFDPFFSTKSIISNKTNGGVGLGMSECYNIMISCNGKIEVESSPDNFFTKVSLHFPKIIDINNEIEEIPSYFSDYSISNSSILIIEDDITFNTILKDTLKSKGYKVVQKFNGISGLNELKKNKYDLLLLDLHLPKMFGAEILNEMEKLSHKPQVIIISGNALEYDSILSKKAFAVCQKPIDIEELYHTCYFAIKNQLSQ